METAAFYETTFGERDHGYAVSFLVIPSRSIEHWDEIEHERASDDLAAELNLALRGETRRLAELPDFIAAILRYPTDVDAAASVVGEREDDARYQFAEHAAFARVVAAEASPLGAESLASLITSKPVAGGAGIALALVGFGPTPLLLVAAPVGIILMGASMGIADALQSGLRQSILRKMGVDEESEAMAKARA